MVELNPVLDDRGRTADLGVELIAGRDFVESDYPAWEPHEAGGEDDAMAAGGATIETSPTPRTP